MPVHIRELAPEDRDPLAFLVDRARVRGELGAFSPWIEHGYRADHMLPASTAVAEDDGLLVGVVAPQMKALIVEPDRRRQGIGSRLVDAGLAIEERRGLEELYLGVRPGDAAGEGFLRATGFAFHSSVIDLELPPHMPAGAVELPAGLSARTFDRTTDVDAWAVVFNDSFADHPTPIRVDPGELRQWVDDRGFRDEDTILVTAADGTIAGYASVEPRYAADGSLADQAEVWALAVAGGWRGRGLGRALLRLAIGRLRDLGVHTVTLSVSTDNRRAGSLYDAEGFVPVRARDRWSRSVARAR